MFLTNDLMDNRPLPCPIRILKPLLMNGDCLCRRLKGVTVLNHRVKSITKRQMRLKRLNVRLVMAAKWAFNAESKSGFMLVDVFS